MRKKENKCVKKANEPRCPGVRRGRRGQPASSVAGGSSAAGRHERALVGDDRALCGNRDHVLFVPGVIPLPVTGMGEWGRGSDAGCGRIRTAAGQQEGRWTERSWALGVPAGWTRSGVWDTALGDTMGQAGPDYVAGSDSRQKTVSVAKQNCTKTVLRCWIQSCFVAQVVLRGRG